ncbi:unnamed protein product [Bathycoccus prasinos]
MNSTSMEDNEANGVDFTRERFSHAPRDPMRDGLHHTATTTTTTTTTTHPVEQIQNHSHPYVLSQTKKNHLAHVYGIALPAQMDIERQILQNVERLPNNQTVKSKRFGLEILSGNVDRIGFEDYLGQMEFQPEARAETGGARSHGTKVRIRVKWTERQIEDEKKKTTRRDEILIERRRCSSKHTYRALRS